MSDKPQTEWRYHGMGLMGKNGHITSVTGYGRGQPHETREDAVRAAKGKKLPGEEMFDVDIVITRKATHA